MVIVDENGEIKGSSPGQIFQYFENARSDLHLLRRAKIPESTIDALEAEYSDILVSKILTYPSTLTGLGLSREMGYQDKKEALGIPAYVPVYSEAESKFIKMMKYQADGTRKAKWKWRIVQEMIDKSSWYPFFITLTIDPSRFDPKMVWEEGREFRKYIRRLVNIVCKEVDHPPAHKKTRYKGREFDYRPESEYLTYFGVIEHGKSREHHHMHLLVWMREIPSYWKKDPNRNISDPSKRSHRNCTKLRSEWDLCQPGRSTATYFRTKGDIWSKIGFSYPIDEKTGKPIKCGDRIQGANYVIKYLQKEHQEWHHRVKATRNLGMKRLKEQMTLMTSEKLEALSWRPKNYGQHHLVTTIHSVPLGLMRCIAKQIIFARQLERSQLDLRTLLNSNKGIFMEMLRSVRNGARPHRMLSQDCYDWVCRHLPAEKGFCEKRFLEAHRTLKRIYPPDKRIQNQIILGANNIEST